MNGAKPRYFYADDEGTSLAADDPNLLPEPQSIRRGKLLDGIISSEERQEQSDRQRSAMFGLVGACAAIVARSR